MNLGRCGRAVSTVTISSVLMIGLVLLLNETPQTAYADPVVLFASAEGSGTACTQASPCSLQTALANSIGGNTVYVATGIYTGTAGAVVTVTQGITLQGGWDGFPTGDVVCDPVAYPTTLHGEDARRVLYISGDITPTVEGFIITGGNATGLGGVGALDAGGGIYVETANPIIVNNVISGNVAYGGAGAEDSYGGGIYLTSNSAMAVISGNLFVRNIGNLADTGRGGGLAVEHSDRIAIINNTFQSNRGGIAANSMGGGVYLQFSSPFVRGNTFQDSSCNLAGTGHGGAIYSQGGSVTLDANTIISSTATYGAVLLESNPSVSLTNNIIAQNPAGGVFVRGSASNPFAGILVHNTIAQNGEEGLYVGYYDSGYSTLTLKNNIIVSHTTGIYVYTSPFSNVVSATHTLFYGNDTDIAGSIITSTDEITGSDPLFVGPWDYHLQAESPAIDAGIAIPGLSTDVDGDIRPSPAGGGYDIGADEFRWRHYLPLVMKSTG